MELIRVPGLRVFGRRPGFSAEAKNTVFMFNSLSFTVHTLYYKPFTRRFQIYNYHCLWLVYILLYLYFKIIITNITSRKG